MAADIAARGAARSTSRRVDFGPDEFITKLLDIRKEDAARMALIRHKNTPR
jgi:hypothetical protein